MWKLAALPLRLTDAVFRKVLDLVFGPADDYDLWERNSTTAPDPRGCMVNPVLSNVCSRGTKSCYLDHVSR